MVRKLKKNINIGRIISNSVAYILRHTVTQNTAQKQFFKGAL